MSLPLAVLLGAAAAGSLPAAAVPRYPVPTPTVEVVAHWSRWQPSRIVVPAGVPVRFVVRNTDPIAHEFIVGDADVQERHERGTEPSHGHRPTELDLPALSTVETTITFDHPGRTYVGCHVPGHTAYGMTAVIEVG